MHVAAKSLDRHVLTIVETFNNVAETSRVDLDRQALLLAGVQADLNLIRRVRVHPEFLSPNVRKAIEVGGEPRTLGDYVSTLKMNQVAETCARTHGMSDNSSVAELMRRRDRGSQISVHSGGADCAAVIGRC